MNENNHRAVKRLNTTLPPKLAEHVGILVYESGLYETPSEFIRDLIRRHMNEIEQLEKKSIDAELSLAIAENDYAPFSIEDVKSIRNSIKK